MKKRNGFTLIELLAVIIILAIVALIATPKVLDIIEDTRRSAFEQSARGYYKAAEYIYNEMFLEDDTQDINFTFKDGVQTSSNSNYKLEVSGEKPKGGLIYLFKDGRIMLSIHNNKYCANVDHEGKVSISEDINDCTSGITEIPSECFSITSETVDSVSYNMLDYDRTNPNCPLNIDTLIIPSEVNGQPVEGIGSYAFHHTRGKDTTNTQEVTVKSVIIPEGVKIISTQTFNQSGLTNVIMPSSLIRISSGAFNKNQLTTIDIPQGVAYLGTTAFRGNKLTSVILPNSITKLLIGIFWDNQLTSVTIPDSVTTIASNVFNNNKLTSVTIGSNVTSISANAFKGNQLTNVTIPSSVTTIDKNAFADNAFPDANAITIEGDNTRFDSTWTTIGFPAKPKVANELLKQYNASNTVGLLKDTDNTYYYKGTNEEVANNFVWFGGHLWRVISIDTNNNLTMITQQPLTNIQLASATWTTQAEYEASYINHWLNSETDGIFYKSLEQADKYKILNSTFNVGIYTNVSEITANQKVGLLNETQYIKAGGQNSFLDIKNEWLLGDTVMSGYVHTVISNGSTGMTGMGVAEGIRPVVKISNITFTSGKGTLDDPYRESSTTTNTANIKVGEYVSIPTTGTGCGTDKRCLFRVVSKDNNSIKVTLNGLLASTSDFGSTTTYTSGNTIDTVVTTFANTISNTYRYTGTDKTFGIGTYPFGANYTTVQSSTYGGTVGLPVVGEMFSGNDIDVSTSEIKTFVNINTIENPTASYVFWTMNARDTSKALYCGSNLNEANPTTRVGVRPVLFLNQGLTFTGGEGTAENPFILE